MDQCDALVASGNERGGFECHEQRCPGLNAREAGVGDLAVGVVGRKGIGEQQQLYVVEEGGDLGGYALGGSGKEVGIVLQVGIGAGGFVGNDGEPDEQVNGQQSGKGNG